MGKKVAKLGALSLLTALVPVVILAFVLLILSIAIALRAGPGFGALFGIIILPFILLVVLAIDCAALIMSIAGIFQKNGNKMATSFGIILSFVPITLLVAIYMHG